MPRAVRPLPDISEIPKFKFWFKVDRSAGRDGCWLWKCARNAEGYGRFKIGGRLYSTHRIAFALSYGPIEDMQGHHGSVIRHLCDTPACCNPEHLRLGSQYDNVKDMMDKGRGHVGQPSRDSVRGA